MDIQQMKLMALEAALHSTVTPNCGSYSVENPTGTSRLQCSCYQRTSFTFSLHGKERNTENDWRYQISELSDQSASAWLRGAGVDK